MSGKELSCEAQMYLDCAMGCKDVYELQNNFFPKHTLKDLREALEFVGSRDDDYGGLSGFMAGIDYQKEKQSKVMK